MNTTITRPFHRLRLQDPAESREAGAVDAQSLLGKLREVHNDPDGVCSTGLVTHFMGEIITLAQNNRSEECTARLNGFASIVGPILRRAEIDPPSNPDDLETARHSGHKDAVSLVTEIDRRTDPADTL